MSLLEILNQDPTALTWRCGHEDATGVEVLRIARPGLVLQPSGVMVPRKVFHTWMFSNAERALRAHVPIAQLEEHDAAWLTQGLALIGHPMEVDPETRGAVLMTLASLNMGSVIGSAPQLEGMYSWTRRALQWAAKRVLGERHCPYDPVSLNEELVELHRRLAATAGGDEDEARSTERAAQIEQLINCWRAVL